MSDLTFLRLSIESFKSFVGDEPHVLDFRDHPAGLHYMRGNNKDEPALGSNGSGKSSLWDALCWCLWGRTTEGLRNPDIRPWYGSKKTRVVLTLSIDKQKFEVTRTTHPNQLMINGKETGAEGIEELLGMNFDLFTNTVLLGQNQPLFFDLQPKAKMQLFSDVLGLDRWDTRAASAAERVQDYELYLTELEGKAAGIKSSSEQVESLLQTAQTRAGEWTDDARRVLKESEAKRKALADRYKKVRDALDKAELTYDGAALELKHFREKLPPLQAKAEAARLERAKAEMALSSLSQQAREIRKDMAGLAGAKVCPICKQSLKGTSLAEHIKSEEKRLTALQAKIDKDVPAEITNAVVSAEAAVEQYREYEKEYSEKVSKARAEVDLQAPAAAELKIQLASLEQSIRLAEKEINPYDEQVSTLKKRRGSLRRQAEDVQDEIAGQQRVIERTRLWVRGFKDIRLYITQDVLQELELTTNAMLEEVGLLDWRVQYLVEKEAKVGTVQRGLAILITSPRYKEPVRWESWSGGERQRLRIVGALALAEVLLNHAGMRPNLEILDEPTRDLSGAGTRDLVDFLATRGAQLEKSIFYVDHLAVESTRFTSVLSVTKDRHGSHLHVS